jgi:hypothetical protein
MFNIYKHIVPNIVSLHIQYSHDTYILFGSDKGECISAYSEHTDIQTDSWNREHNMPRRHKQTHHAILIMISSSISSGFVVIRLSLCVD